MHRDLRGGKTSAEPQAEGVQFQRDEDVLNAEAVDDGESCAGTAGEGGGHNETSARSHTIEIRSHSRQPDSNLNNCSDDTNQIVKNQVTT